MAMMIEQKLFECYENLSRLSPNESLSRKLHQLAEDELEHMNSLKLGKNYAFNAPDLFDRKEITEAELE